MSLIHDIVKVPITSRRSSNIISNNILTRYDFNELFHRTDNFLDLGCNYRVWHFYTVVKWVYMENYDPAIA